MTKKCKCKPDDRRLTIININGNNVYSCRVCGRLHGSRHTVRRNRVDRYKVALAVLASLWILVILVGMAWR